MTIGILYICTGPYVLFWEDFYKSFEKNFLNHIQKKYFVFTDSKNVYADKRDNVKVIHINNLPWPLITLLRFDTFLSIEDDLQKCDYLMFSNANIICDKQIGEEELLPSEKNGENLFVTYHPGYYGKKHFEYPYDRNKKSLAYIPWNCGKYYVIGAMFGGRRENFIEMAKTLKSNIEEDLKKNIIARWHDESHLNRYIMCRKDVRYLSPSYCYPYGMQVNYEKKISAISKQSKFDVKSFKGIYEVRHSRLRTILGTIKRKLKLKERLLLLKDTIMHKKIG